MITTLLLCLPLLGGDPKVNWEAPTRFIAGSPFEVSIDIEIPADGSPLAGWLLTPAAFTLNGKPVAERKGREVVALAPGATLSLSFDLGPSIESSKAFKGEGFELGFAKEYLDSAPIEIQVAKAAPKGLNFMEMPLTELSKYQVVISTNRGDMVAEFWPDAAPNHVRNFLDLSYTGFYDGLTFHRVIPGFMIQGGCPDGTGSGRGPRSVEAEFSKDPKYKHVAGVLSMARTADPNSATSQFFVMHGVAAHLDGQYSSFGKLVEGLEVVDAIVNSPKEGRSDRPKDTQYIKKATVIVLN